MKPQEAIEETDRLLSGAKKDMLNGFKCSIRCGLRNISGGGIRGDDGGQRWVGGESMHPSLSFF